MTERTFVMIKPDHFQLADDILALLDKHGRRIATAMIDAVPRQVIEEHYAPHIGKPFYGYMTCSFVGRPVVIAVYEGPEIIPAFIKVIGATDPVKAGADTIRGSFSSDSLEKAIAEQRPVKNVVHRSDSSSEAEREINVWRQYLRI